MSKLRDFKIVDRITQRSEVVDKYLADISKVPLLNRDEEYELSMKMISGDSLAKEKIINANLRFVVSVAKSFNSSYKIPFEDLISQGNLGLVEAAETFDPTTGFKFISYAVWHIRKQIYQFLSEHSRTIRIPTNVIVDLNRARRVENRLMHQADRDITIDEILTVLEEIEKPSTFAKLARAIEMTSQAIPLEREDNDSDFGKLSPIAYIDSGENPERSTDSNDTDVLFKQLFIGLSPFEKEVVIKRLGLIDGVQCSFKEISQDAINHERGLSVERIRQIFAKALKKIKKVAIQINWVPDDYQAPVYWFK